MNSLAILAGFSLVIAAGPAHTGAGSQTSHERPAAGTEPYTPARQLGPCRL